MIVRTTCRVCEGSLEPILDLGEHYVSDFLDPDAPDGTKAPLELVLCRRCRLLQLRHTVPAETMYRNYWYRSGTNQTMRNALADIAHMSEHLIHLKEGDTVLDIGCNDGTLLAAYKTGGVFKVGFDPAENLATFSRKIADHLAVGFFDSGSWFGDPGLAGKRPLLVTSIAMFYDLEDPNTFVSDVKRVMDPDGLWVVQMSYLPSMLKTNEIGNVCHEHLEYYSLQSFEYLLRLHGFEVVDVELNDVNGGSIRAYIRNRGKPTRNFSLMPHTAKWHWIGSRRYGSRRSASASTASRPTRNSPPGWTGSGRTWWASSASRWDGERRFTSMEPRRRGTRCSNISGSITPSSRQPPSEIRTNGER
jgi:SAM-dependent methyltransferase